MLKNYIKVVWRNILKNKGIFAINIIGLSLGMAACLIIMLFVVDELSYDRFNKNADEIVRVVFNAKVNGEEIKEATVMAPVAKTLKEDFPEVMDATRLKSIGTPKIVQGDRTFRNSRFAYVDPNFFNVFTLPILKGNLSSPLDEPNSVVLTESEAKKYFGDTDVIGKTLLVNDEKEPFKVTAIIEEIPRNSHFRFDILASMKGDEESRSNSWMTGSFYTYLLLEEGSEHILLEHKLPQIIKTYMGPQMLDALGLTYEEFTKDNQLGFALQPLTDIHLKSDFSGASQMEEGGDIRYVYIFSVIAIFMLLIACVNFMNLSTASASKRAKEVGVRKVLGSDKRQLINQFLTESIIATILAMVVSAILLIIFLPVFNRLSNKTLEVKFLLEPSVIGLLLPLTILIGVLAGGYPAFFLSSFKPITALRSKFVGSIDTKGIRGGLVVFQFVISAGLILATLVVHQQMEYIQAKNLGYDKDQLLVLRESYLLGNHVDAFKNEIAKDARVANVTQSAFVPAGPTNYYMSNIFMNNEFQRRMPAYAIDEAYIPTMGMKMVKGRNFSKEFGADSTNVIINEQAAKTLGFAENPLGQRFSMNNDEKELTVIGVVRDFHFRSLHQAIEPLIMVNNPYGGLIVRAKGSQMSELIGDIKNLWESFNTRESFSYGLLDDSYNQTYIAERKMGEILGIFSILTIFVACLGLFGLVTFTAEQRFKEIGIRKVLGSTVTQIVAMLSRDFLKLVFVSFFIAFPLGYYLMDRWLQGFAYRIQIQWWLFLIVVVVTIAIAMGTIGWKSFKAATRNPVNALRNE